MSKLESRSSLEVIKDEATRDSVTEVEEVAEILDYSFTKEENRSVVRKFDLHILPLVWGTSLICGICPAFKLIVGISLLSLQLPRP